jgi:hypothetical protein
MKRKPKQEIKQEVKAKPTIESWLSNVTYDLFGVTIFNKNENGELIPIADMRGWAFLKNAFGNDNDADKFQDKIGEFITEAIREKLERQKNMTNADIPNND